MFDAPMSGYPTNYGGSHYHIAQYSTSAELVTRRGNDYVKRCWTKRTIHQLLFDKRIELVGFEPHLANKF